ncbi:uncharacterized protein LOC143264178 [Megachile rotundata]|uniref:uncharacterized protein LOC143264173 n=1 Tax=Megachile rotundata TaxID=143995 RepID=UPI003FD2F420
MGPLSPILQGNANHSAGAQDVFLHTLAEWDCTLGVIAEPYRVPDQPHWFADAEGRNATIAIVWRAKSGSPPCTAIAAGRGAVAVRWGDVAVVGVYAPPSWPLAEYEELLDRVGQLASRCPTQRVLVLGDFNAKAREWGSPRTDVRGQVTLDWAAAQGLLLLNRGSASTCVRPQGESVVDLSWGSPAVARMDKVLLRNPAPPGWTPTAEKMGAEEARSGYDGGCGPRG